MGGEAGTRTLASSGRSRAADEDVLSSVVADALSPICAALAGLFSFFIVFNLADLPERVVWPVVGHDAFLVVTYAVLWGVTRNRRPPLPIPLAHATGACIAGLALSNILLAAALLREVFYTNYVIVVMVGLGSLMLSTPWVVASLTTTYAAWAVTMWPFTTSHQFLHLSFTLLASGALSLALHATRKRSAVRVIELREVDACRKIELEKALLEAEHSRDNMELCVSERTQELCRVNDQLLQEAAQRERAQDELRLAARVFASSNSGITVTDPTGRLLAANPAFLDLVGRDEDDVVGMDERTVVLGCADADARPGMGDALCTGGSWEGEITARHLSGRTFSAWQSTTSVRDPEGQVTHYVNMYTDITARKAAEDRIEFLAHHDSLTGLSNRVLLQERFTRAIRQDRQDRRNVALLFIDLDRFKTINDSLGHMVGDRLLQVIAERLGRCVRSDDTVCRQGGDEFLIILERIADLREVTEVAERILREISEPFICDGRPLPTSCSIGISIYPKDGEDFDTLLQKADIAMYQSKASGRNMFHYCSSEPVSRVMLDRLDVENGLRGALERGELSVHYQPIVDLGAWRVVGAEALLRWSSPERGAIPPSVFIPLAEETGLIVPIGQWVLEEACREAVRWRDRAPWPLKVAVNISGIQFKRTDLAGVVENALQRTGLPAPALELELTESILITDVARTLETVRRIHALGVSLAVDDFGTGYSSLAYLRQFPVDTLKIDQSFVRDVLVQGEAASIVSAIVQLGRSLSLRTLAEGVEREDQARHLQGVGCGLAQGYLFARPLPAGEFLAFLDAFGVADFGAASGAATGKMELEQ